MPLARYGRPGLLGTVTQTAVITGTAAVTANVLNRRPGPGAGQQAVSESEAAVREAEAEAAAAERAAERYSTVRRPSAAGGDDLAGQLADLAKLRESGALSQAEFERAKSRLLGS